MSKLTIWWTILWQYCSQYFQFCQYCYHIWYIVSPYGENIQEYCQNIVNIILQYCYHICNNIVENDNIVINIVIILFTILSNLIALLTILLQCVDYIVSNLGEGCWWYCQYCSPYCEIFVLWQYRQHIMTILSIILSTSTIGLTYMLTVWVTILWNFHHIVTLHG